MPKMPDKNQVGDAGSYRSGRQMVSADQVDFSAVGRGMKNAAAGLAQLGQGLEQRSKEDEALDLIKAEAAQRQGLYDAEREFDQDPDYPTQEPRFTKRAGEVNDKAAGLIRNPETREKWRIKADADALPNRERIAKRADGYVKQERLVTLGTQLDENTKRYSSPDTPDDERERIYRDSETAIELAKRSGIVDPVTADKFSKQFLENMVEQEAETRKLNDPEGLRRELLGGSAPEGEMEPGNIDLSQRPVRRNDDGTISTIKSMSFRDDQGREVLIPTLDENGKEMAEEEAIERYLGTGEHLGMFETPEQATKYAKQISQRQGRAFMPAKGSSPEAISIRLETGRTDPAKGVSNISGDSKGSKSYGNFGLNSMGSAQDFVKTYGKGLGLRGEPGTAEFDNSWKAVAEADPKGLHAAEMSWYKAEILEPTRNDLVEAGVPQGFADDPRVQAYFADRKIQQGKGSIANHASRIKAAADGSQGDVGTFLRDMTENDRQNLGRDFKSAIATGVYGRKGNDNRVYGRLSMSMAMGDDKSGPIPMATGRYARLSPLKQAQLLNSTEAAYRKRFEGDREQLKRSLDSDVESIRETGVSGNPNLDRARKILEPNQVQTYFLNRREAEAEFRATNDLPSLDTPKMLQRLNTLKPVGGESDFEMRDKVYKKAKKMADDIITWRDTDPAKSVEMLPDVRDAADLAAANPDSPEAVQNLARVRIEAQAKTGVPENRRSPITQYEAKVLMAPIRGLEGKSLQDAMSGVISGLEQQYGPYARAAGVAAVEQVVHNREQAETIHGIIKRSLDGLSPSAELSNQLRYYNENGAAERAFNSFGNRLGDAAPSAPMQGDPFANYGLPKPSVIAKNALKGNPALASEFELKYGPGSAAQALNEPDPPLPD